eukprot:6206356-Pleurochrysis_carterae.AAC.1
MSMSGHSSCSAAAHSAALSSCRLPAKTVARVDLWTGRQSVGSAQSHTVPRAHAGFSDCYDHCRHVGARVLWRPRPAPTARAPRRPPCRTSGSL